ncbi:MAG: TraR/DksA C4-type zinc finger protein [Firmicutes bacterium]|nr:TraR/DksA C4-type zinc finger protein [Bacillota bacterium]
MKEFGLASDGMEELLAIIEINSCFCDGIQYVTGCTLGNNALIYRDYGKTAVTLCRRDGRGLRLAVKSGYREQLDQLVPEFTPLFQKVVTEREVDDAARLEFKKAAAKASFMLLEMPWEDIITAAPITIAIPEYAPIRESIVCENCHENVMGSKIVEHGGKRLCRACAAGSYGELNGAGIVCPKIVKETLPIG